MEHGLWWPVADDLLGGSVIVCISAASIHRICVREGSKPEVQKHSCADSVPLAWCLEGDRRVSAVLLLPQVECLTINTVSNSPTQKAVTVFKRPFILSSHCTGEAAHVSLQPFADYRHKCTATHRCNCHPCRNILADFKLDYVSDSLIPTASPFPSAAEGHLPTTDGIGAKYDIWMNDTDCYHISAGVLSPTKLKTLCIGMLHFTACLTWTCFFLL